MLARCARQEDGDHHATPRPHARIPGAGTGRRHSSRAPCSAHARHPLPRPVALGGPGPAGLRAADARPGRDRGERGAAGHRRGAASASQRTAVGDDELHPVLRRADAAWRTDRRPVRRAAPDPDRPGRVHRIVAAVRTVTRRRDAAGRAVAAGPRRGADVTRRAGHGDDAVHRPRPGQGAGRVVDAGRGPIGPGRDPRRRAHLGGGLAVGVRDQRADRRRPAHRDPAGRAGPASARRGGARPRSPRRGAGHRRDRCRYLRADQCRQPWLVSRVHRAPAGARRRDLVHFRAARAPGQPSPAQPSACSAAGRCWPAAS